MERGEGNREKAQTRRVLNDKISFFQVVPEYERAVIFRLGRLMDREAKGPGNNTCIMH